MSEPWAGAKTVGFIMVGEESDEGYNQAVYEASLTVKKDLGVKTLLAANVPETQQVTTVMQEMVNEGAKIIFATSYGYQQYAYAFAKAHPTVLVLHQGGQASAPPPGEITAGLVRACAPGRRTSSRRPRCGCPPPPGRARRGAINSLGSHNNLKTNTSPTVNRRTVGNRRTGGLELRPP